MRINHPPSVGQYNLCFNYKITITFLGFSFFSYKKTIFQVHLGIQVENIGTKEPWWGCIWIRESRLILKRQCFSGWFDNIANTAYFVCKQLRFFKNYLKLYRIQNKGNPLSLQVWGWGEGGPGSISVALCVSAGLFLGTSTTLLACVKGPKTEVFQNVAALCE